MLKLFIEGFLVKCFVGLDVAACVSVGDSTWLSGVTGQTGAGDGRSSGAAVKPFSSPG
jgi:hypothetical protein